MEKFIAQKEVASLNELSLKLNRPIYIVGGFVRNFLAGFGGESDIDICSDFSLDEFARINNIKITPINKRLGTCKIDYGGFSYEYTRFRSESYNAGGEHAPSLVDFVSDLATDAHRRDFSINSIYFDTLNFKLIDPLGGIGDIKSKTIRCFNPKKVFASDGLRLLRLCRFAAQTGYKIQPQTKKSAKENRHNLAFIAPERKRDELDKILVADTKYGVKNGHYRGLKLLTQLNLWEFIAPQIMDMKGVEQNPKYHRYDVLEHTFRAVKHAYVNVRLAALLHDIGKPVCQKADSNMFNHAAVGADIARQIMTDLCYPAKEIQRVKSLIKLHMFDLNKTVSTGKMRLFAAKNFDILDDLQALVEADGIATGQKQLYKPRFLEFKNILINEGAPLSVKDLEISGTDCVKAGLKGAQINSALSQLWSECVINPHLNNKQRLLAKLNSIAAT